MRETEKNTLWRPLGRDLAASRIVLSLFLIGGCALWNPDAARAQGASGDAEITEPYPTLGADKRPRRMSVEERKALTEGLISDRANARHADGGVNREGTPTRPLDPARASAPPPIARSVQSAPAQAAPAPARSVAPVQAAPIVQTPAPSSQPAAAPVPAPAPVRVESPREAAPAVGALPPEPAMQEGAKDIGAPPPPPKVETFQDAYARRMAEFETGRVAPAPQAAAPQPVAARPASAGGGYVPSASAVDLSPTPAPDRTIRLIRPGSPRNASGARALGDYRLKDADSFTVGAVAFGEGTAALAPADAAKLPEIAALAKKSSTRAVRVIGLSASQRLDINPAVNLEANRQLAAERADQIARELVRLGVPARKIYAGPGDVGAAMDDAAEIIIDY